MSTAIPTSSPSGASWTFVNISDGVLTTKDRDKVKTELPVVEGRLRRIGVHYSEWNGQAIEKLEAELEGRGGETFLVQTSLKSSVATGMFGSALAGIQPGTFIAIRANRSKEPTPFGGYLTFVDVQAYDETAGVWRAAKGDKDEYPGDAWKDKQPALLEALKTHPCYGEREGGGARDESEYGLARTQLLSQGWPDIENLEAAKVYLELFNKSAKKAWKSLGELSDSDWAEVRLATANKPCPKTLQPFLADDEDPFADE